MHPLQSKLAHPSLSRRPRHSLQPHVLEVSGPQDAYLVGSKGKPLPIYQSDCSYKLTSASQHRRPKW